MENQTHLICQSTINGPFFHSNVSLEEGNIIKMRDLRWRAGGLDPCHRFTGNHEFLGESQKMGADFAPQNAGKFQISLAGMDFGNF